MFDYVATANELIATANKIREKLNINTGIQWKLNTGFADDIDTITDIHITRMYIDTPPNKTIYSTVAHDVFDPTGMVVMIDFTSGDFTETGAIINGYTYPTRELTTDDTSVTISYTLNNQTVTCQQPIAVYEADPILNNNSWDIISVIAQSGTGDTYWDIGDCKAITFLSGKIGDYLTIASDNYVTYVYILDFNYPINKTIADNNIIFGGFKTALTNGKDIALCDTIYPYPGTNYKCFKMLENANDASGWAGSYLRYYILGATETPPSGTGQIKVGYDATNLAITSPIADTLMAVLPEDFKSALRLHTHYTHNKKTGSTTGTENITRIVDAIFLLSEYEVFGINSQGNSDEADHQKQMAYFIMGNSKIKYNILSQDSAVPWYLCSSSTGGGQCQIKKDGTIAVVYGYFSNGVAPAFKV